MRWTKKSLAADLKLSEASVMKPVESRRCHFPPQRPPPHWRSPGNKIIPQRFSFRHYTKEINCTTKCFSFRCGAKQWNLMKTDESLDDKKKRKGKEWTNWFFLIFFSLMALAGCSIFYWPQLFHQRHERDRDRECPIVYFAQLCLRFKRKRRRKEG